MKENYIKGKKNKLNDIVLVFISGKFWLLWFERWFLIYFIEVRK